MLVKALQHRTVPLVLRVAFMLFIWGVPDHRLPAQTTGTIEIDFLEEKAETPIACRVQILDSRGRPMRARGTLFEDGWNLVEKPLLFKGRPGDYTYRVFHGPQFAAGSGGFTLDRKSDGYDVLRLPRHANLDEEGWIGGDLLSHNAPEKSLRWLPAEDLRMAVAVSNTVLSESNTNPINHEDMWIENFSYHDDRPGSGLILHHWMPPADVPKDLPSTRLLVLAKQEERLPGELKVHAEIQRLWARDVPIWLAAQKIDSIQILSDHVTIDGTSATQFTPIAEPDPGRFRGARGPARLVEFLYWQLLETGLRIPPSAGSGFGQTQSPLGYNRVYASIGSNSEAVMSANSWWEALRAGRTFVTSGPLLRAKVNGELPGAVFQAPTGNSIALDIGLTLTVSDPVEYLDVIFNGKTLYQARLDEYAKQGGKIPTLAVNESGWLVIRVITERPETYRIATTAPFYLEIGNQPRISKSATEFFLKWLDNAAGQIAQSDQAQASEVYLTAARAFWLERLDQATVP